MSSRIQRSPSMSSQSSARQILPLDASRAPCSRRSNSDADRRLKSGPAHPRPSGSLSRPDRRSLLKLLLLPENVVDFRLQPPNPFLLPLLPSLPLLDKAIDQQVLKFGDPRAFLW